MKTDPLTTEQAIVPVAPLYGLVLMGGQSTRMGQDKSALMYHGKPQREHLTDLLAPLCQTVYWSVNEMQYNHLTYSSMLLDSYPETGPLGGLVTAFHAQPTVAWLLVPCDLPHLNYATLETLVAHRDTGVLATAFCDREGAGPEPLVSLWEPAAGPLLRNWFGQGQRSPRRFLRTHPVTLLPAPAGNVFDNVNDWEGYLKTRPAS